MKVYCVMECQDDGVPHLKEIFGTEEAAKSFISEMSSRYFGDLVIEEKYVSE